MSRTAPAVTRCPADDVRLEAFASERHGVDSDVQQDFSAIGGAHRDRMLLRRYRYDDAIARCVKTFPGRIDRDSITEHARRKDGIGDFVERRAPALQG